MKLRFITRKLKKIWPDDRVSLCLHIGMPKTGTTAIQHFLDQNREALRRNGTLYPTCGIPTFQHAALVKSIAEPRYPWVKFNAAIECFDPVAYVNRMFEECRQKECSRILLSSEFFWAAPAMQSDLSYHTVSEENLGYLEDFVSRCGELFRVFDRVQVIVYLRRQDVWLDSFFGQQIKDGFTVPEEQQLLEPRIYLLYAENLQLWAREFGEENILVRIYGNQLADVTTDFCQLVGLHCSQLTSPAADAEIVNTRLTPLAAEIMQKALTLNIDSEALDLMKRVLRETSFVLINQNRQHGSRSFAKEFLESIRTVYQEENNNLQEMFPAAKGIADSASVDSSDIIQVIEQCPEQDMQQVLACLVSFVESNVSGQQ